VKLNHNKPMSYPIHILKRAVYQCIGFTSCYDIPNCTCSTCTYWLWRCTMEN